MKSGHPIPDAALTSHLAILGMTGAGKSYAARGVVERLLSRGERACILDPTGVWWGLRLRTDGRTPSGLPVAILGGRHGDVGLDADRGAAVAKLAGSTSTPLVLDLLGLTTAARTRFFTGFAEALLAENIGPLHVVIDEAHLFMPQTRVQDPQSGMMLHAGNNLVSLGRARGLRVMLLSQRPAKLHKDSLSQVEALVAMKFTAPQDRAAVETWVGDQAGGKRGAEIVASLPTLRRGEGWVWAPGLEVLERASFPQIDTFDSMKPPESGAAAPVLPPINLAAVVAALAPTLAVDGEPTPARNQTLRDRNIKARLEQAERRGYDKGYAEGLEDGRRTAIAALREASAALAGRAGSIEASAPTSILEPSPALERKPVIATKPPVPRPAPRPEIASSSAALPPARQRVLDRLAWFKALGLDPVERARVCVMVGLSPKASTFGVYVGELARDGLVEPAGAGMLRLTAAGAALAAEPEVGSGPEALVAAARQQLKPQPLRVFDELVRAYPAPVRRNALADALDLSRTASTLGVYIGELSSRGFAEPAGRGEVRAADFLFPHSRDRQPRSTHLPNR